MNIPDAFSKQPGFILLPVMLTIAMLGAIAYLMNYEGAMNANSLGREIEASQAQYAAKSGMNAMQWKANQANCTGYSNINATAFGTNSYSTTITPTSGSPVSIQSAGTTATGASYTIARDRVPVYQTPTSKVIQPSAAASKDTLIYQLRSSYNYGGNNTISVSGVTFLKAKALMQFDLASISAKAKITSATLQLYQNSGSNIAGPISVRPITSIWTAGTQAGASNTTGATWTNRDTTNNWSTAGGDYGATAFATHEIPNGVGWASWDIASLVTGWLSGSITNNGLMLQPEESWVTANFASAENGDPLLAPKLTINYTCECGQTCDPTPPVTLPLAHWMLDEISGLTAVDSVGGHNGSLINGPIWSAGKLNGALNFDGINDYIDVPHHKDLSLTTSFTLSAWIKSYALQADTAHTLIAKEISINNANYWFGTWGDELNLGYSIGGVWNETITSGINLQTNTWYHVAVSFNATGNQVTYYLNGVDILKATMPGPPATTNTSSLKIGRSPSGEYWKGLLDDVRIYDSALPVSEISGLYAMGSSVSETPPLPGGCNGTYRDEFNAVSFAGNDGTLTWKGNWLEVNEADGPTLNDVRVLLDNSMNPAMPSNQMFVRDNDGGGEGVMRALDLNDAGTATLSFDYKPAQLDDSGDYASVQISTTGTAGPWKEIVRFSGPADTQIYRHYSTDISAYATTDSVLRIITSPNMGSADYVFFDNVQVECKP